MSTPGPVAHVAHLARRFAGSWSRRPPAPDDLAWVGEQLLPAELDLWRRFGPADQRHTVAVARRFVVLRPAAPRPEIAGALLHDIGKLSAGLGTVGRVVATVVGPRTARFRTYHAHEALGADELARIGSDPLTVALVRGDADPDLVAALRTADDV